MIRMKKRHILFWGSLLMLSMLLNGEKAELGSLYDNDYKNGLQSADAVELPDEYEFIWDSPITADTLRVATWFAAGQGPTFMDIQVKKSGGEYESVALSNITWLTSTESIEYVDIPIKADQIVGLKLIVNKANIEWGHYVINELKLFSTNERDVEKDNATTVKAMQLGNDAVLGTNLTYLADEIISTGKGTGLNDLANEDFSSGYASEDDPTLPQEIEIKFQEEPQVVQGVRLSSHFSKDQAPTLIEVSVKTVGGAYKKMGSYFLEWQSKENIYEHCDIKFSAQSNVEAIKITVKRANLTWKHYVISELQVF